ncbi:MAG TPA: GntG family PLP-dependent aldolase [Stellaceae bacterium]|nr:GntG family PLP-dependent aldolase [Stellaceae bacterium]
MIDFRSDTLTKPTDAMLRAQHDASQGDDSRDGDPTVRELEAMTAELLGKEAGLFVVSGTMGNLVALLAHGRRGGEVLVDQGAHLLRSELGGVSLIAGLFPRVLPDHRGAVDIEALGAAIRADFAPDKLATALVWLETTHNNAGGAVLPLSHMRAVREVALRHGVPSHLDGARLFNASTALAVAPAEIVATVDSVSVCLSKGLSAPVGSVLVGSAAFINRARAFRRMVGGNLRQAGGLAAAGIVALTEMMPRLAEDHATARHLAAGLAQIDPSLVDPSMVETNIVQVDTRASGRPAADWAAQLRERGIVTGAWDTWRLRCVTHRHIAPADVAQAIAAFRDVWSAR